MENIISEIKRKKELSGIPDDVVARVLEKYLQNKQAIRGRKDIKIIIKSARKDLRNYVGRFTISGDYSSLIGEGKETEVLNEHKSTKERMDFYPKIKEITFSLNPQSILDLGCGLNPIALARQGIKYYALDIDDSALALVSLYFKKHKIPGNVSNQDIRNNMDFPKADVCLIFKVFDILKLSHKKVSGMLSKIDSKKIIASFSTVTLSGKPMKNKRRFWFEKILSSSGLRYSAFSSKNELFYLIDKN